MTDSNIRKCLLLVGFMGCGKSTTGRAVAGQLGWQFIDLDRLLEERAGKTIPEIFAESGETVFRKLEHETLASLSNSDCVVIATGGGIVTNPDNIPLLRNLGFVVWLHASEETIFQRVSKTSHRPLLQTENPRETIARLLSERENLYRSVADCMIQTDQLPRYSVISLILKRVKQYFKEP